MSDIAFSVIVNNNGIDDIVFKTIMLKGDKGNSVDHIEKTSTSGLVDTYTIYLTDGTVGGTFTVTNGSPVNIDDTVTAIDKTWSSSKLSGMIKSIDDNVVNADKLWSSQKINSMLAQTGTIEDVAIASFSDGADDVPLSELTVDIEAWQEGSGEPSPDNVRAIHGWNECNINKSNINLWDEQWENGTINNNGEDAPYANNMRSKGYIPITPNTSYRTVPSNRIVVFWYDANKDFISMQGSTPDAITSPSNAKYARFRTTDGYGGTYNNDISFNYPATDTSYHAHDGGVDTIEFGQTVCGGQLDVTSGKFTVTQDKDSFSNRNFDQYSTGFFATSFTSKPNGTGLCEIYTVVVDKSYANAPDNSMQFRGNQILIKDTSCADTIALIAKVGSHEFTYELATPFDIDLTPREVRTLLNANNIYANTGNVDKIVYFKTGSEAVARMIEAYMRAQPEE